MALRKNAENLKWFRPVFAELWVIKGPPNPPGRVARVSCTKQNRVKPCLEHEVIPKRVSNLSRSKYPHVLLGGIRPLRLKKHCEIVITSLKLLLDNMNCLWLLPMPDGTRGSPMPWLILLWGCFGYIPWLNNTHTLRRTSSLHSISSSKPSIQLYKDSSKLIEMKILYSGVSCFFWEYN